MTNVFEMDVDQAVEESLDNATANGYDFSTWSDHDIAVDLATYCVYLEQEDPEKLIPHIKKWRENNK